MNECSCAPNLDPLGCENEKCPRVIAARGSRGSRPTSLSSNPRSLHFAEMLDRAETFSDRERGELADLLRAMTFEGGEAETCIERLTRERDTWRGHYQDLLDDAASVRQEMIRRDAERDRLRAALERIKRIGPLGVDTYPECYRRMHAIAVAALSGEPTSAVETAGKPTDTECLDWLDSQRRWGDCFAVQDLDCGDVYIRPWRYQNQSGQFAARLVGQTIRDAIAAAMRERSAEKAGGEPT